MTFSIVAYDPEEAAWGVAVASKFLAAAAVVSWARAGAGAVATQSFARVSFGPDGLALMESGRPAAEALAALLAADPERAHRQVGMVDPRGGAAAHTGSDCYDWAGHHVGEGFTCQGNILAGPQVVAAMADAYRSARGELADRLLAALTAGDDAGGDRRGKQSAGVLVVKANAGYGGDNDRYIDLRVDDDPEPVRKLHTLVAAHHLFFGHPRPEDQIPITADLAREIQVWLRDRGYHPHEPTGIWDDATKTAFRALIGSENLEERWSLDQHSDQIDRVALDYLRARLQA
ncbi:MAG: DUF1028 domain-containing protein [Anaerolineae bacterium]|nr:DUF1028 domain-containing protein [Anaerolineae bacterium]